MGGQKFMERKFIASEIDSSPKTDFNPFNADQALDAGEFYSENSAGTGNVQQSDLMEHVWEKARYEWEGKFP